MNNLKSIYRGALLIPLFAAVVHGADRPFAVIPLVERPPALEADTVDPTWDRGTRIRLAQGVGDSAGAPVRLATDVTLLRTDDALYLRFACANPAAPDLETRTRERDEEAYTDESVEVFLDTHDGSDYVQLVVNASGSIYDGRKFNSSWNGAWTAATHIVAGGWEANIRVPFATLGGAPAAGTYWLLNLCRNTCDGADRWEHSAWVAPGYHRPLGLLYFGDIDATPLFKRLRVDLANLRRIEEAGPSKDQRPGARMALKVDTLEAQYPNPSRVAPTRFAALLAASEELSRAIAPFTRQALMHAILDNGPENADRTP